MPHNDCGVFGTSCQFCAVVGKLAEPDFVAVLSENLLSVAWELFPTNEERTYTHTDETDEAMLYNKYYNLFIVFLSLYVSLKLLKYYSHSRFKSSTVYLSPCAVHCVWVLTGCRRGPAARTQSPVQCPA